MSVPQLPIDYIRLGRRLRRQRNRLGLTQLQLAQLVPCSLSYISHIENGDKPSLEILIRLVYHLDLSLDTLFYEQGEADLELISLLHRLSKQPPHTRHTALSMILTYLDSQS